MRIVFVLPPINLSGGLRVVAIYAESLIKRGHRVLLVSPPAPKVSLKKKILKYLCGIKDNLENKSQFSFLDKVDVEHIFLDRYRSPNDMDIPDGDIVVATWWKTAEWVNDLSPSKGAKVYFVQGYERLDHLPADRVEATYRFPFQKIVVAKWLRDLMLSEYGDDNVILVPNAVDKTLFYSEKRTMQNKPTVGFLFSKVAEKGVDVTVKAIKLVSSRLPNLKIVSFGSYKLPESFGLRNVEYYFSPRQDIIRTIYASCDVWVTASRVEGFNLPAMEAMSCRTPVVSTKTGWPQESIKDGVNGYLVDIDDEDSLAESIFRVLTCTEKQWQSLSEKALDTVKNSTWDNSVAMFEEALFHACKRSKMQEIRGSCQSVVE